MSTVRLVCVSTQARYLPAIMRYEEVDGRKHLRTKFPAMRLEAGGVASVPKPYWDACLEHAAVKKMLDGGVLRVDPKAADMAEASKASESKRGAKDKPVESLLGLPIAKAKPYVVAEEDIAQLMKWRNADNRQGMFDAIDSRIDELSDAEFSDG